MLFFIRNWSIRNWGYRGQNRKKLEGYIAPTLRNWSIAYFRKRVWFEDKITWYATMLGKLRVSSDEDGSNDYISPEVVNGDDVNLIS